MSPVLRSVLTTARRAVVLCVALVSTSLSAAPALQDGPYVAESAEGAWVARWVETSNETPRVHQEQVRIGSSVNVPAVGRVPAFKVELRKPDGLAPNEARLRPSTPLFVMADTHGELEIAVELLKQQHVIDSKLRWAFGKGHLAILGDVFDRGPNQTEILWLLYKLEGEAAAAGGGVHLVLGNHEAIALSGDTRYLNPKYEQVRAVLSAPSYAALWNQRTLLGRWLRNKASVLKLGRFLCLHGGISREAADRKLSLAQMNDAIRATLDTARPDNFVMGNTGPLWYRGYFPEMAREGGYAAATSDDVDAILAFYGVKSVFVGHTMVPTVTPLFAGRVVAVQVYPHRDEASGLPVMEGLLVKQGRFYRARIDGKVELLSP